MARIFGIASVVLSLIIVISGCSKTPRPDAPDETFYINLMPGTVDANVGDTLLLTGNINSVEGLFAISFDLVYDTSVVSFLSVSLPQGGILGQNSISFSSRIGDGVSVSLGRTQTSGNDNVSASGPLFAVRFIARQAGNTEIQFRDIYIIDEVGTENSDLQLLEVFGAQIAVQ